MRKVTFNTLNPQAKLFSELKENSLKWWEMVKNDPRFYIEIRKDNQVNVYYEGGSVVRLHYCSKRKKLQAFTHEKYLGNDKGKSYIECADILDEKIDYIIERIQTKYSQKHGVSKEKWSEKYIQGNIRTKYSSKYIDSEFAYKNDEFDIRIDLIECINGELRFVELKRLDDARMLKEPLSEYVPEVITQMTDYKMFIRKYKKEILDYYKKVYDIKKELRLPIPNQKPSSLNETPHLLIFNRWEKSHPKRDTHTRRMEEILKDEDIDYEIVNEI